MCCKHKKKTQKKRNEKNEIEVKVHFDEIRDFFFVVACLCPQNFVLILIIITSFLLSNGSKQT